MQLWESSDFPPLLGIEGLVLSIFWLVYCCCLAHLCQGTQQSCSTSGAWHWDGHGPTPRISSLNVPLGVLAEPLGWGCFSMPVARHLHLTYTLSQVKPIGFDKKHRTEKNR